jgi:hypothetical protein
MPTRVANFAPYIEIMAGVYTDNQPDFSFLQPGETKSWSQYWYPIQKIGPAQHANLDAAVSLRLEECELQFGVAVTRNSQVQLSSSPQMERRLQAFHTRSFACNSTR